MKVSTPILLLIFLTTVGLMSISFAQMGPLQSLRGAEVEEPVIVDQVHRKIERRIQRNYRQQPPLIPHSIAQYQIDLRTNQCLGCHDWSKAGERNAPTLSMTHYLDRNGKELDQIAGTRYFCNQCHVQQADTPPLVENLFRPSHNQ